MNKDVDCPYCGHYQDINHDDGYGYEEDVCHSQNCENCGKEFVFTTSISFYYESFKADCLNGAEHKFELQCCAPREFTKMVCIDCDEKRKPTDEEFKIIMSGLPFEEIKTKIKNL